jgi:ribosomal 50S subunit-recycling heat shock protein
MAEGGCRLDVWLWRARFFKTRSLAAREVEAGRVRIIRRGEAQRVDKPSRAVTPGDEMVFALAGRLRALRVEAIGARRGPPAEARMLYHLIDEEGRAVRTAPPTHDPAASE